MFKFLNNKGIRYSRDLVKSFRRGNLSIGLDFLRIEVYLEG